LLIAFKGLFLTHPVDKKPQANIDECIKI